MTHRVLCDRARFTRRSLVEGLDRNARSSLDEGMRRFAISMTNMPSTEAVKKTASLRGSTDGCSSAQNPQAAVGTRMMRGSRSRRPFKAPPLPPKSRNPGPGRKRECARCRAAA